MIVEVDGLAAHAATGGVDLAGRDDQPAMVLLHGAGMDGTVWQLQTRYLAHRGLRVAAVDLPGHGRSDGEPLGSIEELADWVGRFLDAAGLQPTNVVGHSMGSFIGLDLAARRPELVTSLTLLGTADGMPVHPDLLTASEDRLDEAAALMAAWGHGAPAHVGLNPTPGLWMLGGARALVETSAAGVLTTDFRACMAYGDALDRAAAVTCPISVVVGSGDKMTPPRATAKLIQAIEEGAAPSVEVITLADTGHMMMVESPEPVRRVLVAAAETAAQEPSDSM
ncbi:MAG: alpha/beta hydrolase [Actinomycetota bacterium]